MGLEVLYDQTTEQEFERDGKRVALADQISALPMIARDLAERLNEAAGACIDKAMADAKAQKGERLNPSTANQTSPLPHSCGLSSLRTWREQMG
ncbi:hypothetical protein [Mesorhizobium sp. M1348]|uniref:hypothetical protein n=1 Tax=unclassified Mesorhizobium TaxID=325217 RepID=UPI003334AE70